MGQSVAQAGGPQLCSVSVLSLEISAAGIDTTFLWAEASLILCEGGSDHARLPAARAAAALQGFAGIPGDLTTRAVLCKL